MGSDLRLLNKINKTASFNPRSRMGSDTFPAGAAKPQSRVSIHAPAWGATLRLLNKINKTASFNPRSRMGSDVKVNTGISNSKSFNPRSRMGSDNSPLYCWVGSPKVSIHAPAWGATSALRLAGRHGKFQSTLPHGERPVSTMNGILPIKFQSTLPHGERPHQVEKVFDVWKVSIHAPAWGAT